LRKEEGEQSFRTAMIWQEFAFKFERRTEDAPAFFFFTEKHRKILAGEVFDLLLRNASLLPKEKREASLEQARWIAQNLGDETHMARLEKALWG